MKVGMIFECGPFGADKAVCEHLIYRIKPDMQIVSETLDNKPKLIAQCGDVAASLLDARCERVVIIWDLYPPWRERGVKPCRKEDRENIMLSLQKADADSTKVALVCIEEELEAWLLADERAISKVLSKPHRPVRVDRRKRVGRIPNPKGLLRDIFRQNGGRSYNEIIDAVKIVSSMPNLNRLKKVDTFRRFALKTSDVNLGDS